MKSFGERVSISFSPPPGYERILGLAVLGGVIILSMAKSVLSKIRRKKVE